MRRWRSSRIASVALERAELVDREARVAIVRRLVPVIEAAHPSEAVTPAGDLNLFAEHVEFVTLQVLRRTARNGAFDREPIELRAITPKLWTGLGALGTPPRYVSRIGCYCCQYPVTGPPALPGPITPC